MTQSKIPKRHIIKIFFYFLSVCIILCCLIPYDHLNSQILVGFPRSQVGSTTINGNSALQASGLKTGSGTFEDPFIIQNLNFSSPTGTNRLNLWNIDMYLIIKNCTFVHSGFLPLNDGVSTQNVSNLMIENCTFYYNAFGINLTNNWNVTVRNSTFYNYKIGIRTENCTNFSFYDNNFLFAHSVSDDDKSGIYFSNVINGTISTNNINDSRYGLYFKGDYHQNIHIRENNLTNNTIYGVVGANMTNFSITNNVLYRNGYSIPYATIFVKNLTSSVIENNTITNNMGIYLEKNCDLVTIKSNTVHNLTNLGDNIQYGIRADLSSNLLIDNNTVHGRQGFGLYFLNLTNSQILNNIANSKARIGLILENSRDCEISHNILNNNDRIGLYLRNNQYCNFSHNEVLLNGIEETAHYGGIYVYRTHFSRFIENNASYNYMNGIYSDESTNNLYQVNSINWNRLYGIWFYNLDNNNSIIGNEISHTQGDSPFSYGSAIMLEDNANNYIAQNQISNNSGMGIYLDYVENITIHTNNLSVDNYIGIYGMGSSKNDIRWNRIDRNRLDGIQLEDCEDNVIFNNTMNQNFRYGLFLINTTETLVASRIWLNDLSGNGWSEALSEYPNDFDNGTMGNHWGDYLIRYPNAVHASPTWNTPYEINGTSGVFDNHPIWYGNEGATDTTSTTTTNTNTGTSSTTTTNTNTGTSSSTTTNTNTGTSSSTTTNTNTGTSSTTTTNTGSNTASSTTSFNIPYFNGRVSGIAGYPGILLIGILLGMLWFKGKKFKYLI
jgi:parallel beta-helix repeat protein